MRTRHISQAELCALRIKHRAVVAAFHAKALRCLGDPPSAHNRARVVIADLRCSDRAVDKKLLHSRFRSFWPWQI